MRLSELQTKKVISVTSGKSIGNIVDINIQQNGNIESFIIESNKNFFALNKEQDIKIGWSSITKIGEDVILVKTES